MPDLQTRGYNSIVSRLSSMKFAIYLLIVVGVITALGTIIPQGQTPAFYLANYGHGLGTIVTSLSLDHLYQAWWFYVLIGFLGLTILLCAFQRLRRARTLTSVGSLLFHLAIVVILTGAAWSLGYALSAQVDLAEQQTVALVDYGFKEGQLTLDSFAIDYYPDFQPRQYTSGLSLRGYENQDHKQLIYVNNPLRAGSLKIYQSSWGWMLKLDVNRDEVAQTIDVKNYASYQLNDPEHNVLRVVFLPDYAEDQQGAFSQTPLPNNPYVGLSLMQADRVVDMALVPQGQTVQLGPYNISLADFSYYSGLQIKYDPGVNLVFAGFGLLLLGLLGRYWHIFFSRKGD